MTVQVGGESESKPEKHEPGESEDSKGGGVRGQCAEIRGESEQE